MLDYVPVFKSTQRPRFTERSVTISELNFVEMFSYRSCAFAQLKFSSLMLTIDPNVDTENSDLPGGLLLTVGQTRG